MDAAVLARMHSSDYPDVQCVSVRCRVGAHSPTPHHETHGIHHAMSESKAHPPPDWPRLGEEIATRREELGLSKVAAASETGLSVNGWRRLEEGKPGQVDTLLDVAKTLGWHPLYPYLVLTGNADMLIVDPGSRVAKSMIRPSAGVADDGPTVRIQDQVGGYLPIPPEVASLLDDGQLLDYTVVPSPNSGLKFAVLAVRQGDAAMGDSAQAAAVISATKRLVPATEFAIEMDELPQFDLDDPTEFPAATPVGMTQELDTSGKWRVVMIDEGRISKVSRQGFETIANAVVGMNKFTSSVHRLEEHREQQLSAEERAKIQAELVRRYHEGESIRSLAAATGESYGFVHRLLAEAGVSLRGRGGATRGKGKR